MRLQHALLCCLLLMSLASPELSVAETPHLLMISVDGLRPDYVTASPNRHTLPTLRKFLQFGVYAEGVKGVLPTVTFSSHTTLITGVWPSQHGIYSNTPFDPLREHPEEWYWYAKSIQSKTLWEAAKAAGLTTASIGWPVTSGESSIDNLITSINVNEDGRTKTVSTNYPADLDHVLDQGTEGQSLSPDERKVIRSIALIQRDNPNFFTLHLTALDHAEHETGPFSAKSNQAVETLDSQLDRLVNAELAKNPNATIVIVSDHGQINVSKTVNLSVLFVRAGLIQLAAKSGIPQSWDAAI